MKKTRLFKLGAVALAMALLLGIMSTFALGNGSSADGLTVDYCNLSFKNEVQLVYAIKSTDPNVRLLIWTEPQTDYVSGTQKTVLSPLAEQENIEGENYTVFKYTDLTAKQMADTVYARACIDDGEGVSYGEVHKYSILQYVYNKTGKTGIASTDTKLVNMLNKMLEYGAAAQEYQGYKTDRPATASFYQVKLTAGVLDDGCNHGLYLAGDEINLSAPLTDGNGEPFTRWENSAGTAVSTSASFKLTVGSSNETYTPVYGNTAPAYSEGLEFESNGDGTCALLGMGTCTDTDVVIPATSPEGDAVADIDRNAFADEAITSISLPSTITYIGKNAFSGCTALTDVYFDGTANDWANVDIASGNSSLENATMHFTGTVTYTVTFKDWDGTELKIETVNSGASATAPADPERNGFSFTGWDIAFDNVTSDLTVTAQYSFASSEPTIVVDSISANAGETDVAVTISLVNNPGLTNMILTVDYDSQIELKNVVFGGTSTPLPANPVLLNWYNGTEDIEGDWVFATLYFDVASNATGILPIQISYDPENVYDLSETNIDFNIVSGAIEIL